MNGPSGQRIPKVTVLLPVYNSAPFLRQAVDSILAQTRGDFELLAIDDGSTDASLEILHSYHDPRLRIIQHPRNLGLVASLNEGLDLAHGEYVARMDADDAMVPERLAEQSAFLDARPDIAVVAAFVEFINTEGAVTGSWATDRATADEAAIGAMLPAHQLPGASIGDDPPRGTRGLALRSPASRARKTGTSGCAYVHAGCALPSCPRCCCTTGCIRAASWRMRSDPCRTSNG
jgi:glycosyltransferase involved in cell wall biosynthesis